MAASYVDRALDPGDLIAELAARAPANGANTGVWPGLVIYRFTGPTGPTWEEIQSLSLCIVAQGRKAVTAEGQTYVYDSFRYLVLRSHLHFQAEILEASPSRPFLSLVLQIDPSVVRQVSSDMVERRTTAFRSRAGQDMAEKDVYISTMDTELLGAVLRFLRATRKGADRRVLAPLYLQEMVYRVLQREQFARLLALAEAESASNPVSAVLEYMQTHLADPLTVADMAELVSLSPSAFAHMFRDITGRSPYQFLKEMRLARARELLVDGNLTVARVSKEVGYASVSHFIAEFRGRFGVTPRAYSDAHAVHRELDMQRQMDMARAAGEPAARAPGAAGWVLGGVAARVSQAGEAARQPSASTS
jgi:AraC-like DNA-binding protein